MLCPSMPPETQPIVVDVVIAAKDAATSLPSVIAAVPSRAVRSVVVVDYGSSDSTGAVARDAGAIVLRAPRGGYGAACQRAIEHLAALPKPSDVVVFLAADGSDEPSEIPVLVTPIARGDAELVIGTRAAADGRLQRAVAVRLIGAIYRHRFDDLGPFRAIALPALVALGMSDNGTGFGVEMQVKAVKLGLRIVEIPVSHRRASGAGAGLGRRVRSGVDRTSRTLFHILRHATAR